MAKVIIRHGLMASIVLISIFLLSFLLMSDHKMMEVVGYTAMFLSMGFIFFGIRKYRDEELGGKISFVQALTVGLLIALIPSILFGLFDTIYTFYINPTFMDPYFEEMVQQVKDNFTGEELEAKLAELKASKEAFFNPLMIFVVMGLTVFLIGAIETIIFSIMLTRNN